MRPRSLCRTTSRAIRSSARICTWQTLFSGLLDFFNVASGQGCRYVSLLGLSEGVGGAGGAIVVKQKKQTRARPDPNNPVALAELEPGSEVAAADFDTRLRLRMEAKEAALATETDEVRFGERGWKERYYEVKLHVLNGEQEMRRQVLRCYVEGLCWVLMYYYQGVQDWGWFYPFHYAPCASQHLSTPSPQHPFFSVAPFPRSTRCMYRRFVCVLYVCMCTRVHSCARECVCIWQVRLRPRRPAPVRRRPIQARRTIHTIPTADGGLPAGIGASAAHRLPQAHGATPASTSAYNLALADITDLCSLRKLIIPSHLRDLGMCDTRGLPQQRLHSHFPTMLPCSRFPLLLLS